MKDSNVAKGIKKIIIAQYFAIIALLFLSSISFMLNYFEMDSAPRESNFYIFLFTSSFITGSVFVVTIVISVILNFLGYYQASKDELEFKKAMICAVIVGVLSLSGFFFQVSNGTVQTILSSASTIFEMFVMIFSISGLINIAENQKRPDMAEAGDKLLKFLVVTFIISAINALVIRIFELSSQAIIVSIIVGVIDFVLTTVQFVMYIIYLTRSLNMFKASDGV